MSFTPIPYTEIFPVKKEEEKEEKEEYKKRITSTMNGTLSCKRQ